MRQLQIKVHQTNGWTNILIFAQQINTIIHSFEMDELQVYSLLVEINVRHLNLRYTILLYLRGIF